MNGGIFQAEGFAKFSVNALGDVHKRHAVEDLIGLYVLIWTPFFGT